MTDAPRPVVAWWALAVAATGVGGYGLLLMDARQAQDSVPGMPWLDEVHFASGGLALLVGVWGFRRDVLRGRPALHRWLGKLYVLSVLVSGLAAAAMAPFAMHGTATHLGFGLLALLWLLTTWLGWRRIHKRREVAAHRRWMVRSYALCCAAITLRVQLAPLAYALQGFEPAYQVVSWSCWLPNLLFAEWWLLRTRRRARTGGSTGSPAAART